MENVFVPLLNRMGPEGFECDRPGAANAFKAIVGAASKFSSHSKNPSDNSRGIVDTSRLKTVMESLSAYEFPNVPQFSDSESLEKVASVEGELRNYVDKIETWLVSDTNTEEASMGDEASTREECDFWRFRVEKLVSTQEQLKSDQLRSALRYIHCFNTANVQRQSSQDKVAVESARSSVSSLIRKWRLLEVSISEALERAKDNVKYLSSLEKSLDLLYTNELVGAAEVIPLIINSLTVMSWNSRSYSSDRLGRIMAMISNELIRTCQRWIRGGNDPTASLWVVSSQQVIERLDAASNLGSLFQAEYQKLISSLQEGKGPKCAPIEQSLVFGRFDLFFRRVKKLRDLFSAISQYECLAAQTFDGLEAVLQSFKQTLATFQGKHVDLLDFRSIGFDRDYVDFSRQIGDLERSLNALLIESLKRTDSIEASVGILTQFRKVFKSEALSSEVDKQMRLVYQTYRQELLSIQDMYEKCKANPPIGRDCSPVVGSIHWSRNLLRRVEEPIKALGEAGKALAADDKATVRLHNRLATRLIEFETIWYQAWISSIDEASSGLRANVIIRHPSDGKLYVNLDAEIVQLIRESKCLDRMGIVIPDAARLVLHQSESILRHKRELQFLIDEFVRVCSAIPNVVSKLLKAHVDNTESAFAPAMNTLTWTSLNVGNFITSTWTEIRRFEALVVTVTDCMRNRIDANLETVACMHLVKNWEALPLLSQGPDMQDVLFADSAVFLGRKSREIEAAVEDLVRVIIEYPIGRKSSVSESEIVKIKAYYNWSLFHSFQAAVRRSMDTFRQRLRSSTHMFSLAVQLDGLAIQLHPPVAEIQARVTAIAVAIMKTTKTVDAWANAPELRQGTFYDRIVQDKDILKSLLLLLGTVPSFEPGLVSYGDRFTAHQWLWQRSIAETCKSFMATDRKISDFEQKLVDLEILRSDLKRLATDFRIASFCVKPESLVETVDALISQWMKAICRGLHEKAKTKLDTVAAQVKQLSMRLARTVEVGDISGVSAMVGCIADVRVAEREMDNTLPEIHAMYALLERSAAVVDKDEQDAMSSVRSDWTALLSLSRKQESNLKANHAAHKNVLQTAIVAFAKDVNDLRAVYEERGPAVAGLAPKEALDRLRRFKEEFELRARKQEILFHAENLFGLPNRKYVLLDKTRQELIFLGELYDLYVQVLDTVRAWKDELWTAVPGKLDSIRSQVESMSLRCRKLPKELRDLQAFRELKSEIDEFSQVIPLLVELGKPSIMPRHWHRLGEASGKPFDGPESLTLALVLDANLFAIKDEILEICDSADKELVIERKLAELQTQWASALLDFNTWRGREYPCVLAGGRVAELQEQLEETMVTLNSMNAMRQSVAFREPLTALLESLSDAADTLDKWTKVQLLWTSLESVFTGGDIAKQLPVEAKKFQQIDKDWIRIMAKSAEVRLVVNCCKNEALRQILPALAQGLETCQKSLESYLEGKRSKFPRFYFVSDPVLLKILSQGSDPESIQDDMEKLFDAVTGLQFAKGDKRKIVKLKAIAGNDEELLELSSPMTVSGNVEDWLSLLEAEMRKAVRRECRLAAQQTGSVMGSIGLKEFADRFIAQVALLGIGMIWTADCQDALSKMGKDRSILATTNKKMQQMLSELVAMCLTDLGSRMNRTKFETLVTIHVHQRDLFVELWKKAKEHKVKSEADFEWLKQTRFYWRPDADHAVVSVADVDFTYSYEYLGVKERLVITPLTDRCYLTLTQALGICYGGAPAGPAGTGKTETVKDMARTLGLYCVVTNCSDQHRYKDMAKIFKGLCSGGVFGCFDEFNRIDLEVLSVVAMQVEAITLAKKQHAKTFLFPGESVPLRLVPSVGYFITMNPGYAGRNELPENLKNLFRSVSMMIPDREIIMRVKLASVGYSQMDVLGKKFNILYQLCEQQLSKQRHYDFGLRNILSVLRTAGGVKRSEPADADEETLFMRTVRDMNLSKLVADDVPLFLALLKDLFPRVTDPPKKRYVEIEKGITAYVKERKLVMHDNWALKVTQLYETSLVRHGLMVVGPTLCGKTEMINALTTCLTEHAASPHRIITMNPKAITDAQMYGVKDVLSDEWTPGVFASIWQRYNNRALKYTTWIICDGPVDAIWIENLNSVLDDNKILTLANNDRIPMTENCRIVFEVENLNNASPATVSRTGIVFVSASDLPWTCMVDSWLQKRKTGSEIFKRVFDKWIRSRDLFGTCKKILSTRVMYVSDSVVINNLLNLIGGMVDETEVLAEAAYLRISLFAIAWSVGGLLETLDDRRLFSNKLVEVLGGAGDSAIVPVFTAEAPTLFEFWPDSTVKDRSWRVWKAAAWVAPKQLQFSSLLIPTMDTMRAEYLLATIAGCGKTRTCFRSSVLLGSSGTAKTSTVQMYLSKLSVHQFSTKRINLSSATTPLRLQKSIEVELERKTGKTFCPPGGKRLALFIDDLSMPLVNKWGDQVTLELLRQLVETNGFYFLDKDKRGDFKTVEQLEFIGSMTNPGGGRNDIPNRLKSKFFAFSMVAPGLAAVDSIYGNILRARMAQSPLVSLVSSVTTATIDVWEKLRRSLLPTPQRFHYVFNMRDLSRVFQGVADAPLQIVTSEAILVSLWKHECTRVFSDKLARQCDKDLVGSVLDEVLVTRFGSTVGESAQNVGECWADFQRDAPDTGDDEPGLAPKIYEPVCNISTIRDKAYEYLQKYNEQYPSRPMTLVLFDDALAHLLQIIRVLQQKRGSAMLVGVGGSGKQSLTRLAAFTCNQKTVRIALTKTYNENSFLDDLRSLFVECGQKNNSVTFLLADADIKTEDFLEHINSVMATGEVAGLFQKDEREAMCAEIRNDFVKHRPGQEDTMTNLQQFFTDRVRDNLHIVLCFSPMSAKFAIRAQKFPAVFSAVNINWFLPWPESALTAVGTSFLSSFEIDADDATKRGLFEWLGAAYAAVNDVCALYYQTMRRHVYVTPRSFLVLVDLYKKLYAEKYAEVNALERSVNVGLQKLDEAAADVEKLKIDLKEEEKTLVVAEAETNSLLSRVESETAKGEIKAAEVGKQRDACLKKKAEIEAEQAEAERDLQAALPFLREAEEAVKSITAKDITELKTLKQPSDIIRLVFDGLLILQQKRVCEVRKEAKNINKQEFDFIHDSYDEIAKSQLTDIRFLPDLFDFSNSQKDNINDETCELLQPYLRLANFTPAVAKKASGAAEGLCKWVGAMVMYHEAAKIVKPKMDYLKIQGAKLAEAMAELAAAEHELAAAMAILDDLKQSFATAMERKLAVETRANMTKRKMAQAEKLISGLAGEKIRWSEDSRSFAKRRQQLVGDVGIAAVFVTFCGPFNSEYRKKLIDEYFVPGLRARCVPFSETLDLVAFLTDQATVGEWTLQGLPSDDLSTQNAIMVTKSSRFALMIDPQGQALRWIKSRESKRIAAHPTRCVTNLSNPRLKDQLEFSMGEGLCLVVENVEDEIDPILDPVLDKAVVKKGRSLSITVADQAMDYNPAFTVYMTSRLPNPHFSPELCARCSVIDFTVTQKGLEQQLLGRVLATEQRQLEESLVALMEEVTMNTKNLQSLDQQLLQRLSASSGNLLDDLELIEVLANTKQTAKEVEQKLRDANEKRAEINLKREQYRPVATRGSVLFFCMTDMTQLSNPITQQPTGWMYNCSLVQFLEQFDLSVKLAEKSQQTTKRVEKIVDTLTYQVYRYMNRGLFERDKALFKLLLALRTQAVGDSISAADIAVLLRGGSALDIKSEKPNPIKWMSDKGWLNILQLTRHVFASDKVPLFGSLVEKITANDQQWRRWIDENEPESCPVPDYEDVFLLGKEIGPFLRCVLIRALREDRTTVAANEYVLQQLDAKYVKPVTDSIESVYADSTNRKPVLYLLSAGSDPTAMIDELAKKRKRGLTDKVSMGEGQEVIALEKMRNGFLTGSWVVLQNSHLGLGFMGQLEEIFAKTSDIDEDFRLWITCEVTNRFPIGLLQMSIKVTMEPPMGLKAGLSRTFTTNITQELLDKIDHDNWRRLVFTQAFVHSIVQERRKFGAIGWCIPYEFNNSDMEASLMFLEKHLATTVMMGQPLSWSTIQYMVSEVQYGGRITDDLDRDLFNTYATRWLCDEIMKADFSFAPGGYSIPDGSEIAQYRTFIDTLPSVDSPLVFGLHPNADLAYRQLEASLLLTAIQDTQPKQSGASSSSKSSDEIVKEKALDILSKLPPDFDEETFRAQIAKHKGAPGTADRGFQAPLNVFLFQELQRLQAVITIVRTNLSNLVSAINGNVVMTPDLLEDLNMINEARVPRSWTHDASGAEISWLVPNLGAWFTGLLDRVQQLSSWLENGRLKAYWLPGFLNPQGFLTAIRQEVTRQHKRDHWALDDVVTHTTVLTVDSDKVRDAPEEGQHIYGLFLEGAKWNRQDGKLEESEPKKLRVPMPVIHVTAVTLKDKKARGGDYGPYGAFDCPVYKYTKRTDKYLVFRLSLKTDVIPTHWRLRGVSCLCSAE